MIKRKVDFSNKNLTALELNAIDRLKINGKRFADYEPSIDGVFLNWAGNFVGGIGIGALRVASNGSVGINTENPLRAFHVVGSSTQVMLESTNNHKVGLWSNGNDGTFQIVTWSPTESAFSNAFAIFQNTRNIAIGGTVDSGFKLDVSGNVRITGTVQLCTTGTGVAICTNGADIMLGTGSRYFGATGNLSIGSTVDNGSRLNVNGTISLSQHITYKFDSNQPLLKVSRTDNSHASDIRTNGWGGFELTKALSIGYATNASFVGLRVNGWISGGTMSPRSPLHIVGLPVYNSNGDSIAGGLTEGAFYRKSTGEICVTF